MEILKGQQLLKKSGLVVDADQALAGKKIICFYFSAQWCPPCKAFTPVLAEFYMVSIISIIFINYSILSQLIDLTFLGFGKRRRTYRNNICEWR